MSTDMAETEIPPERTYHGHLVIEWPKPHEGILASWKVEIYEAQTGECISSTAELLTLTVDPSEWVVAEVTHLLGPNGRPARQGPADPVTGRVPPLVLDCDEDGKPKTGVFRYIVTEMRVRQGEHQPGDRPPRF